jgi:hypothetical protein
MVGREGAGDVSRVGEDAVTPPPALGWRARCSPCGGAAAAAAAGGSEPPLLDLQKLVPCDESLLLLLALLLLLLPFEPRYWYGW